MGPRAVLIGKVWVSCFGGRSIFTPKIKTTSPGDSNGIYTLGAFLGWIRSPHDGHQTFRQVP